MRHSFVEQRATLRNSSSELREVLAGNLRAYPAKQGLSQEALATWGNRNRTSDTSTVTLGGMLANSPQFHFFLKEFGCVQWRESPSGVHLASVNRPGRFLGANKPSLPRLTH